MTRYDILDAYYIFGNLYHRGQDSREYGYLCRLQNIGYRPSMTTQQLDPTTLEDGAREVFDSLVSRLDPPETA